MTAETPGSTDMLIGTCVVYYKDITTVGESDVICHTTSNDATTATSMAGTTPTSTYAHNLWLIPIASWVSLSGAYTTDLFSTQLLTDA